MTKWKYNIVQGIGFGGEMSADALEKKLNYYSARNGWEFVGSITPLNKEEPYLIFRSPVATKLTK